MYKAFLIKYGEIGVKGKNRYLFEDALVRQIRYALKEVDGEFNVTKENGRIYATQIRIPLQYDDDSNGISGTEYVLFLLPSPE